MHGYAILNKGDTMTTKDHVVAALRRADGYLSGEELSRSLGMSRAAVNVAAQALRKDGYPIQSATNRGYFLAPCQRRMNGGELLALLPPGFAERVEYCDTVDSTNARLHALSLAGAPDGTVLVANEQTAGRGRMGRHFESPRGSGLYMSLLLRPGCAPKDAAELTAQAAVAAARAVEPFVGERVGIKWVNDLLLHGKKICGILTEATVEDDRLTGVIIGVGVNVRGRAALSPEVQKIASTLEDESNRKISRVQLAAAVITALFAMADGSRTEDFADYRARCVTLGKEVCFGGRTAFAEDILEDYGLVVRHSDGRRETLRSGEISVRGLYGYA